MPPAKKDPGANGKDRRTFRLLPSVEDLLQRPEVLALEERLPRAGRVELVRGLIDGWRAEIAAGRLDAAELERRLGAEPFAAELAERARREAGRGVVPVVNATGVVLHTGLGRAPVHPEAAAAMAAAARGYCVLEVDRFTGRRNRRDDRLSGQLARLTGAEAGIAVNNNAAAVVLTLSTFAAGRETILSRGELVEIGGSFRMPDVMERAGTRLREVGTTNRTRIGDYRAALGPDTGLLLKVHTSNFRVEGFAEEVDPAELAELGRERDVPSAYDLGSGRLEAEGTAPLDMLGDEPLVAAAVQSGVDVVMFSGDKLLGGPQAGLIVGRRDAVERLRKNPLYRALRLDKVTIAGLETTFELLLAGRGDEIPARALMRLEPEQLALRAEALAKRLARVPGLAVEVVEEASQPGSGSAPGIFLPTRALRVTHTRLDAEALAAALRAGDPPVFARIHAERLLLDPRTLLEGDEDRLVEAFEQLG